MRFGKVDLNPANNPAILDTATWDAPTAARILAGIDGAFWASAPAALASGSASPGAGGLTLYGASAASVGDVAVCLAGLPDGQQSFLAIGPGETEVGLGAPFAAIPLPGGRALRTYPADAATVDRYCQAFRPDKGPAALGPEPRLGIGVRMSGAMWPAVYRAMSECRFAANAIQNSVRELELLENILAGRAPEAIYYPGFGTVQSGHTGATFEGLLVHGVLAALKAEGRFRYGADADHIKVNPGEEGLARARHVIECARYYSFYTLDVSGVLDYHALFATSAAQAEAYLEARLPSRSERRAVVAYHRQGHRVGGADYRPDEATLGRLVGKYWHALDAADALAAFVRSLKGGRSFDLELAIDERIPEIATCDCITSDEELAFVLLEARRRGLALTHVAPNFGVEKGVDYRCPGGLPEFEARTTRQYRMSEEFGVLMDFHSGDDLSQTTRQAICRATEGRNHFKIAPEPQMLFGKTVHDLLPDLFREWWEDSQAYAQREAAAGSQFAADCLAEQAASGEAPNALDPLFHNFGFGFVGKRDANGQYINRERLYSLPAAFYSEYQARLARYLCGLADDLFVTR